MASEPQDEVTQILQRVGAGDDSAIAELLPRVYGELRALAGSYFQAAGAHTLQPTALVHEAYLKLVGATHVTWESRAHFFALAAKAMRQVLADHVRRKQAVKRGGAMQRVGQITFPGLDTPTPETTLDLTELDRALSRLGELDPQQYSVVEMRFLGGLQVDEVAHLLGVSSRTVEREWRAARAWLRRELAGAG
jgi:RNA polymerase sigma factor (TIGR02999 family)